MNRNEVINKIDSILDEAGTAVLTTISPEGRPRMRWMTPIVLKQFPDSIFCFSIPKTPKIDHIKNNHHVEWLIQTKDLREIINIQGIIEISDNLALKTDLVERLGPKLNMFYRVNQKSEEWIVLNTKITNAVYYVPMKGIKETVTF